jgi:hypothetical protein
MSEEIGRTLRPSEIVHHLNGVPTDNRLENLRLCKNRKEHVMEQRKLRRARTSRKGVNVVAISLPLEHAQLIVNASNASEIPTSKIMRRIIESRWEELQELVRTGLIPDSLRTWTEKSILDKK